MKKRLASLDRFLFRTYEGRAILAVVMICIFVFGYTVTAARHVMVNPSHAQSWPVEYGELGTSVLESFVVPTALSMCPPPPGGGECFAVSGTSIVAEIIHLAFVQTMVTAITALESYIADWLIDGMMTAFLETLDQAELNLIDWWDTFWFYNLYPALQDFTEQVSVSLADQVRMMQATSDSVAGDAAKQARLEAEIQAQRELTPSTGAAVAATLVGGLMKSKQLGGYMRDAQQDETFPAGTSAMGAPSSTGFSAGQEARDNRYEDLFCNPNSNGGRNTCAGTANPDHYDADIKVTRHLFNRLTIDIE